MPVENLQAISVPVPEATQTATVRFGLAAGPWETIAERYSGPSMSSTATGW